MKTRWGLFLLMAASLPAFSQAVENDDLYFNSKDRAKQRAISGNVSMANELKSRQDEQDGGLHPTDSYASRNVNPEYVSRAQNNAADEEDSSDYFISDYRPTGVNNNLYNNYDYGSGFYSPYSRNGYGNPYAYNPYAYGMNGFGGGYGSGMSFSMGMGYGMGFGMYNSLSMSWGNAWGSPYNSYYNNYYDPFWGSGYGYYGYNPYGFNSFYGGGYNSWYGGGGGYGYGYYPGTVLVINNSNREANQRMVYGKRGSRSNGLNNNVTGTRQVAGQPTGGRTLSTGRTSGTQEYYDRGWRKNPSTQPDNSSRIVRPNTSTGTSSGRVITQPRSQSAWGSGSGTSSWNNNSGNNNNSGYRSNDSGGSIRQSGGNSGGSSGGSRSGGGGSSGGGSSGGGGRGRH